MNTENYEQFGRARPSSSNTQPYFETYLFTLDPSDTGFYVAIQDAGTCVGISRLRVYHFICLSRQVGLVLYPETPAPVSGSVNVQFTCVDNAYIPETESDTVTCYYNETWSTEVPVCECNVGYENMGTNCSGKSINIMSSCRTEMLNDIGMIMLEIKHSMQAEPGGDSMQQ